MDWNPFGWKPDTGDAALLTGGLADHSRLNSTVLYPEGCSVPSMDARLKNNQHSEKITLIMRKEKLHFRVSSSSLMSHQHIGVLDDDPACSGLSFDNIYKVGCT